LYVPYVAAVLVLPYAPAVLELPYTGDCDGVNATGAAVYDACETVA
jgi:hypothetical protein